MKPSMKVIDKSSFSTALGCLLLLLSSQSQSQNSSIDWDVFGAGAGTSSGSATMLLMTAGQNFVDVSSGSGRILKSGFLFHPLLVGTTVSVPEEEALPTVYRLDQNYPNPFNPSTRIRFALPEESSVRLEIYNLLGQGINTLVDEKKAVGVHMIEWFGTNRLNEKVSSGVYFYRIEARAVDGSSSFVSLKKMILLK